MRAPLPAAGRSLAVISLLALAACSPASGVRGESKAPVQRVAVVPVARHPLATEVSITAEFRPDQEVDVMAKVSGYLNKIEVDVGARVRQGQLIATIEVPEMVDELAKNQAAISRSQAELERSRQEIKRAETARELTQISHARLAAVMEKRPGLVAQQEVDAVRNRDLLAQSQIATAQSTFSATEQSVKMLESEASRLRTLQGYLHVTAPFDGVVTKRFADTGAMIQAGSSSQAKPIVRIAQINVLRLILPVSEALVPRLRLGMPVEVRVESLSRSFSGRLARFSHQIQTATRTMETEVDVPNAAGLLVAGMFAQAHLRLDEKKNALSVPVEAVDPGADGKSSVLIVTGEGSLVRREVTLGLQTPDRVEVTSGLSEGELVVVGNRSQLRTGQKVDPRRERDGVSGKGGG